MTPPATYSAEHEALCARIRDALPYATVTVVATRQIGDRFIDPKQIQISWCDGPTQAGTVARLEAAIPGSASVGRSSRSVSFHGTGETDNATLVRRRSHASVAVTAINDALAGHRQSETILTDATQEPVDALARVAAVLLADFGDWGPRWSAPPDELIESCVARAQAATGWSRSETFALHAGELVPAG